MIIHLVYSRHCLHMLTYRFLCFIMRCAIQIATTQCVLVFRSISAGCLVGIRLEINSNPAPFARFRSNTGSTIHVLKEIDPASRTGRGQRHRLVQLAAALRALGNHGVIHLLQSGQPNNNKPPAARTQRSTNHSGMGAPWGGRVVGRCLGHCLFSSYSFFEI